MIETFQIFSHDVIDVKGGDIVTVDFLTNEVEFAVQNRASNIVSLVEDPLSFLCNMFDGRPGVGAALLQSQALPPAMFLPRFRNSEAGLDAWYLNPTQRVSFTYQNLLPVGDENTVVRVQSLVLGQKNIDDRYGTPEPLRPMQYATPATVVPAGRVVGGILQPGFNKVQITLDQAYDFQCRAFTVLSTATPNTIAVLIRNVGTQYAYMNVPIMIENCAYDFSETGQNFQPKPFSPFMIRARTTLEIAFYNYNPNDAATVAFGFWGEHCKLH